MHDELVLETPSIRELIPAEFTGIVEDLERLVNEELPRRRFLEQLSQASAKLEVKLQASL